MRVIEKRKQYMLISFMILLIGAGIIILNTASGLEPFNFDVEFTGGASFHIDVGQPFENEEIASIFEEVTGQESPQVQHVTGTNEVMVRIREVDQEVRTNLMDAFNERFDTTYEDFTYSVISATVSADMQRSAILAVVSACAAMLIYISLRFRDMRKGAASILGLVHDILIVIAFYGVLRIPINYSFIAALLTVLGYSINASIILFDRIRENQSNMRKVSMDELINLSINQTLRRSIYTSFTTLVVVLVLYILGVPTIQQFTLPIMIGIVAGTYSSIFLVGPFWYMLSKKPELAVISGTDGKRTNSNEITGNAENLKKAAGAEDTQAELSTSQRKKKRK
jgi:preprotein translocase SecF subunit